MVDWIESGARVWVRVRQRAGARPRAALVRPSGAKQRPFRPRRRDVNERAPGRRARRARRATRC
jgi:hypothetical protein